MADKEKSSDSKPAKARPKKPPAKAYEPPRLKKFEKLEKLLESGE
jgi:hypothetical protein